MGKETKFSEICGEHLGRKCEGLIRIQGQGYHGRKRKRKTSPSKEPGGGVGSLGQWWRMGTPTSTFLPTTSDGAAAADATTTPGPYMGTTLLLLSTPFPHTPRSINKGSSSTIGKEVGDQEGCRWVEEDRYNHCSNSRCRKQWNRAQMQVKISRKKEPRAHRVGSKLQRKQTRVKEKGWMTSPCMSFATIVEIQAISVMTAPSQECVSFVLRRVTKLKNVRGGKDQLHHQSSCGVQTRD